MRIADCFWSRLDRDSDTASKERWRLCRVLSVILVAVFILSGLGTVFGFLSGWIVAPWISLGLLAASIAAFAMALLGREIPAVVLTLTLLLVGTGVMAWWGDGIHDISVLILSAIIITANLAGRRKISTVFTVLTVLAPIDISIARHFSGVEGVFATDEPAELIILTLVLAVIAICLRLLMNDLLSGLRLVRESEARYRGIFTSIQEAYFEAEEDGTLVEISPAGEILLGLPREQLLGKNSLRMHIGGEEYHQLMSALQSRGKIDNLELNVRSSNGSEYAVLVSASLEITEHGGRRIIGSMRDVTGRRELEQNLAQAQKMESIGTLAGGIAHDFNNLLTVINGHSEMIQMKLAQGRDGVETDIRTIRAAGTRAAELTAQLLTFSRRQVVQPRLLDLSETIRNLQKVIQPLIGEDIEVVFDLEPQPPAILVDPLQIEQIFINLLANARDAVSQNTGRSRRKRIEIRTGSVSFSPGSSGGVLEVSGERYVLLSVADYGIGMSPEVRSRVFDPFFTTKEYGTGLGLATVYGIVRQNNAHIEVESQEGQGTTFRVYWPASSGKAVVSKGVEQATQGGSETILLVEDEQGVRKLIAVALHSHGYAVVEVYNGRHALELLEDQIVDLVISDMVMPEMGGSELVAELHRTKPQMKILLISGYSPDRIGGDGESQDKLLLRKPFTMHTLLRTVRGLLDEPTETAIARATDNY